MAGKIEMNKPDISLVPEFYRGYVSLVETDDLIMALDQNQVVATKFFSALPSEKWHYRYAEGKWSVLDILQHLIDSERIFAYRALRFSRLDATPLPGFDENLYAANAKAEKRDASALIDEFELVRRANIIFFRSLAEDARARVGMANNNPISVNAIGFIMVGHVLHHIRVINERYF